MRRNLPPISSNSHGWMPPGCDDEDDDDDDEAERDTAFKIPRFWLQQHDGTICSEDLLGMGCLGKYKGEAALELLVRISRNITRMRWLGFILKVLAAFMTISMFGMLRNMIKKDHFDNAGVSLPTSSEPEKYNVVKIDDLEECKSSNAKEGPWSENGQELKTCWNKPAMLEAEQLKGFITFSLTDGPEYHVLQVLAAFMTITMFGMLGNMIKKDHFDNTGVSLPTLSSEPEKYNVVKVDDMEECKSSNAKEEPWSENGQELKTCWNKPAMLEAEQSKGFITFSLTGGSEYHVSQAAT